mmetsp:Transcript_37406/g.105582  ORF Transcript_37406/g.105582 Transcript_37406/m.105582 type:complete len:313 (-) Transcript_37406:158-1096(-)|eukprot:CAMPEP_0117694770 /NCGR_PEP_ID=MMETSP0804-20121206/27677_1 /TAXON_ID=1074897 /ORGANISM="Tetraselmis astigmatica, Strain CCMP880" /LENGTH=312 /DNA_ID=CAMNT_0005508585 /DNA_START=234 /DNA_END=1172 /DNA_ORIENTATION=+
MAKGKKRRTRDPMGADVPAADKSIDGEEEGEEEDVDNQDSDSEGEEDESEDGDEGGGAFKEINVDFEFYDPQEVDFHGLRALLGSYLNEQSFDLSELVETIIAQKSVGTLIKTSEDSVDPIGVLTVLSLKQHKDLHSLKQIRDFLHRKCKDSAHKLELTKAWDSDGTGLIVSERLVNVPPQIAPPLIQALFDEIEWATEDEPTQELRESFKFEQYIVLTRVYVDPAAQRPNAGTSKEQPAKKAKGSEPLLVYVRPEDEFLHQHCSWSLTFPIEGKDVGKDELQPWRLSMVVPADAIASVRASLDAVVGNPAK